MNCTRWEEILFSLNALGIVCWCIATSLRSWEIARLERAVWEFRRATRKVKEIYYPGADVVKHLESDKKEQ